MSSYREKASHDWSDDSIRLIATPSVTAKSTFFYVQEVGHFRTRPSYFTERTHLPSYLIVFTISGVGYLKYGSKTYTLQPNQAFFIDCMEYQHYATDRRHLWEFAWVHFSGNASRGYYEQFRKQGSPVVALDPQSPVPGIIRQLIDVHRHATLRTELVSSKLLTDLITELLLASNEHGAYGTSMPAYLTAIVHDMDKRFHERLSLDDLAARHAISKFHLVRAFRKYIGTTPNEYVIHKRITYAKELLTFTDLSVAAIAAKVGVDNVSHFINLFKQRVELTPLAFRQKWQQPPG